jgi:tetratricopeptide (TPR) repeat protein
VKSDARPALARLAHGLTRGAVVVLALGLAGMLLQRVIAPTAARVRQPVLQPGAATAQGATLALLGGFRALVADALWLRLYALWERRDAPGTDAAAQLVTAVDPRPLFFWINAARMLAHDLPVWRIEAEGGFAAVPAGRQRQIETEQAQRAIALLDRARQFHPRNAQLWIERANIELQSLRDFNAAAESYRRAWEVPDAPYYAARLHAEMLRRAGRKAEALAWLERLYPELPRDDESAAAPVVLARIRELEQELGVPPERVFAPVAR